MSETEASQQCKHQRLKPKSGYEAFGQCSATLSYWQFGDVTACLDCSRQVRFWFRWHVVDSEEPS